MTTNKIDVYVCSNLETIANFNGMNDISLCKEEIYAAISKARKSIYELGFNDCESAIFKDWHGGKFDQFSKYRNYFIASLYEIELEKQRLLDNIDNVLCMDIMLTKKMAGFY